MNINGSEAYKINGNILKILITNTFDKLSDIVNK